MSNHDPGFFYYPYTSFATAQLPLLKVAVLYFDKLVIADPVGALGDHRRKSPCLGGCRAVAGGGHLEDDALEECGAFDKPGTSMQTLEQLIQIENPSAVIADAPRVSRLLTGLLYRKDMRYA